MTGTALTSELEAVNIILTAIDEAPVASLSVTGLYPLDQAKTVLTEVSRAVQTKGWVFNTEDSVAPAKDGAGLITLPADTLSFTPDPSTSIDPVQRGLRLYDRKAHTFVFTTSVTGTRKLLLPWDDLPQAARHYITIRAAKTLQGRSSVPDSTYRYTQADLDDALQALQDSEEADGAYNMLTGSLSVGAVVYDRDLY